MMVLNISAAVPAIAGTAARELPTPFRANTDDRFGGAHDDARRVSIQYYESNDSVFADGTYLIRGLAGRVLWLVLTLYSTGGRSTFSNRELRLHPFLKLSPWKNNLEARLLLLQRRLDDRSAAIRLSREQRGHLRILCSVPLALERIQS